MRRYTKEEFDKILLDHAEWLRNGYGHIGKRANLRSANLSSADLSSANLRLADLRSANLSSADLSSADLRLADLRSANLSSANLSWANLSSANLRSADLDKIKHKFCILPDGDIIGWKKINGCLIKLLIPEQAKRVNALSSRKCRSEYADVLAIYDKEGKEISEVIGGHKPDMKYILNDRIFPDKFNDSLLEECTNGIHFFITKREAEEY